MKSGQYERWYLRPENPSLAAPKHEIIKTKTVLLQLNKEIEHRPKRQESPSADLGKHNFQLPSHKNRGTSFSLERADQHPHTESSAPDDSKDQTIQVLGLGLSIHLGAEVGNRQVCLVDLFQNEGLLESGILDWNTCRAHVVGHVFLNILKLCVIKIYRMYTVSLSDRVTLERCVVDYCGYMSLLRCVKRGIIWHMAFEDVS